MKVSIVTAAYNAASTIGRTIASVNEQSYPDIEHIIIDGLSKDGTADLARSLSPTAMVLSEADAGLYDAMNKGVARATGDVVALLHSDDHYAHPEAVANVVKAFDGADLDGVFADIAFFNAEAPDRYVRRYRSADFTPARLQYGIMPAHPGMFLKRRVYDKFGLFDTRYKIAADFEFVARLFSKDPVTYRFLDEIIVAMQTGGTSTRNIKSKLTIYRECLRACEQNGIRTSPLRMLAKYPMKALQFMGRA